MQTKIITYIILFLVIFASGFVLSRMEKPYNTLLLTVHKLIGLGAGVYLVYAIIHNGQQEPLTALQISVLAACVVCYLGMIGTGGLLSADISVPGFVKVIHKVLPYVTVAASAAMLLISF